MPAKARKTGQAKPAGREKPGLPAKGTRRTTPSPETLAALGTDRLIGLILGETGHNPAFKKLVSAALAALQGPDAVAALVDRRLTALEGARGYIDWQKRRAFTADLGATVSVVLNELRPLDPTAALARLQRFLVGAEAVLNRVDDSSGAVQGVYERAIEAFVAIAADLPPDAARTVAEGLLPAFIADPYGPLGGLLEDLVPILPPDVLPGIDARLAAAAGERPKTGSPRDGAAFRHDAARTRILRLRQVLADRSGDPDAFMALEAEILPERPDRVAIAGRLLAAGRAAEALDWIRRPDSPGIRIVTRADLLGGFDPGAPERALKALEIEILDALNRAGEAQALRWEGFERGLDASLLRAHLARLPDFEDEDASIRALDHAESFADPHRALTFLVAWPDLRRAARLVAARAEAWRGDHYTALAPAADALAQDHPVAATRLYRRLLDDILQTGRSAAYTHGARYLRELDALAGRLEPGTVTPGPDAYRAGLRQAHGRKRAFWDLVTD